ncbi:hypothetical protein DXT99_22700 [Pontibacter diazotrophicus]|uniref:Uncharacterized protein n=1 Tax=Pontibacter diazotrophicus TaxID=1400979 RepID=A0A3D8L5E8_9BACT|nr:hypothetical protein [Pontibacter diazotrophicus]RDV12577.1 hypothetical protein DXT99_22700 [Pontibacter diazotrophicus]
MNRISLLVLLLLLFFGYSSNACNCVTRKWSVRRVNIDIDNSDLIFIGDRISYKKLDNYEEKYSFKVLEAFKGNIEPGDTIHGKTHDSCSGSPHIEGLWVVYARVKEEGLIDYSYPGCGASRSLIVPDVPLPPPTNFEEDLKKSQTEALPAFLRDWHNEYIILQNFKNKKQSTKVDNDDSERYGILVYVAFGLALAALIVALVKK